MEDGNNFISYKDTLVFDTLFESIYDKLELYDADQDYSILDDKYVENEK